MEKRIVSIIIIFIFIFNISCKDNNQDSKDIIITFDNFILKIKDYNEFEDSISFNFKTSSTKSYIVDLNPPYAYGPSEIQGKIIEIIDDNNKYSIEQCYETSLSFNFDGSGFLLSNWKHHLSDRESLKEENKNKFRIIKYNENDSKKFPKTSKEELKNIFLDYIKKPEYKDFNKDLVNIIKSIDDYPCYVLISKIFLKIEQINKSNKRKIYNLEIILPYIP